VRSSRNARTWSASGRTFPLKPLQTFRRLRSLLSQLCWLHQNEYES
jgi:hypothetical protein